MSSTEPDTAAVVLSAELAERIDALWSDERCEWKAVYERSMGSDGGWWNVYLEWTSEYGNPHEANWVTYTWQFYDRTAEAAMTEAVAWLEALAPWEPCRECDGQGVWNGVACPDCHMTGLANG